MKLHTERALFLIQCLDLPSASQVDSAMWEPFQVAHLNDNSMFRIEDKSRQIAWSFTVAAEAAANVILNAESTVFISINLEEAREKIRYAKRVYDNIELSGLPKIIKHNILGIEFDNDSRILSLPSSPPRGKAKMNIVLDEFAHVQHDREIYTACLPIISKGGIIRIGSSPMGAGGMFWEISQQKLNAFPGYTRVVTPWWKVRAFCRDELPDSLTVSLLSTKELVERYGSNRIRAIFENMLLDDFEQEYCCIYVDESVAFFPWELIRRNQDETLLHYKVSDPDSIDIVLREMKGDIAAGKIESVLVGGVDVGRKKDLTEITLVGIGGGNRKPIRLMVSLDRVEFDDQERLIRKVLQILPVSALLIDQNGLGMHLAENLNRDTCAQGVDFTNATKSLWATELKIQMERNLVPMPNDRDLAYQIHSIKKKVTAAKNNVFDVEASEKHHADKMWALALAVWAVREEQDAPTWGPGPTWERR